MHVYLQRPTPDDRPDQSPAMSSPKTTFFFVILAAVTFLDVRRRMVTPGRWRSANLRNGQRACIGFAVIQQARRRDSIILLSSISTPTHPHTFTAAHPHGHTDSHPVRFETSPEPNRGLI